MKSNSKSMDSNSIRIRIAIVLIAVFIPILAVAGERREHNPYTVLGMQVRSHLLPDTPGANGDDLGPLVFQEIIPCRFVSTLAEDAYRDPWGGIEFQIMESRTYWPRGVLVASDGWENPCSEHVPSAAVAVAVRLTSHAAPGEGSVFLAPASYRTNNVPALWFAGGNDEMREATVVLRNGAFSVLVDQQTHLTIDIIGYFETDPNGYGPQGERGEKGEKGDRGEQGAQGLQGERGETGAQGLQGEKGAQGDKGDKGDRGEQGAQGLQGERGEQGLRGEKGEKGEKGDRGEQGAQGLQGEKGVKGDKGERGERGERGEQGLQGLQGLQGERGAQGLRGEKGEKGDRGNDGAQGPKGDAGAQGPQGPKGDAGAQGAQGPQGPQGEAGAQGAQGPAGPQGAMGPHGPVGPQGPKGPKGDKGNPGIIASVGGPYVFPPGGSLRIYDGAITTNSFVLLTYVEVSNGNALGVASISNGSFIATGSPNKPFKYVVLTAN